MRSYLDLIPYSLKAYVASVTTLQKDSFTETSEILPFYADGFPGIMFYESNTKMFLNEETRVLKNLFLYGQTLNPISINTFGSYRIIVFQIHPYALKTLFGIDAKELKDKCIGFDQLPFSETEKLTEQITNTESIEIKINLLLNFLADHIRIRNIAIDRGLQLAIQGIYNHSNNWSFKKIIGELGISERTLERKFDQQVGVTPKQFSRIIRFRSVLAQLENEIAPRFVDLAYDYGYADQAHFIRDFKEFTQLTPSEYKTRNNN